MSSKSWENLNYDLRTADEDECRDLLKKELRGNARQAFLLRIHSRLNKLRAARERATLMAGKKI